MRNALVPRRGRVPVHRVTRLWRVVGLVALVGLIAAGCGSSSKSSSSSKTPGSSGQAAPSSSKLKGSTITTLTLASVNYAGPTYANIIETPKLYQDWINAHGGIKGHPLKVLTCDEQGDPTKTAQCGREAIQSHAVAVVGSFTLNGNAIIPELAAAHTSWFGICCAVASDELTSPIVQQIGSGLSLTSGLVAKAVADGCKKLAFVTGNDPSLVSFDETLIKNALKSVHGPPLTKTVLVPLTATDYAPQVADAVHGTDCIYASLSPTNFASFMPPFVATGAHQRLYGPQGNLDISVTKPFPKATQGAVVAGSYSDISLPEWSDYRAAIARYHAPNLDYNSLGGLGTWAAYVAFNQVVSAMTAPVTAANFLAAAQKATVNLHGMTANVDFATHWPGLGGKFLNAFNRSVTFDIANNGNLVPFRNGAFYDMTNAMIGEPLPSADIPPGGK